MNYSNHINYNNRHQFSDQRNALINNKVDYITGHRIHQIQTIQINSREEWNNLGDVLGLNNPQIVDYLFRFPLNYIEDLLYDYEIGIGNTNGQLLISMIIGYSNDMFNAIFFVHKDPHHNFIDGEIFQIQFSEGDNIHTFIQEFFRNRQLENVTEYELLRLVRDHESAIQLLEIFSEGFHSLIIEDPLVRNFSFGVNIEIVYNENDLPIPNYVNDLQYSNYMYHIFNIPKPIGNYNWFNNFIHDEECDCAICLHKHDTYVKTPCGHLFGKNCLLTWIQTGKIDCPYCRSKISIDV